jgi:hypothetical protein
MVSVRKYLGRIIPSTLIQVRLHKAVFLRFAERNGFVYFGSVDQHHNMHRLVRGFTLSSTHKDTNYCLGSKDGYDLTFVQRSDILRYPGASNHSYTWTILAIDLTSGHDVPHIVLANTTHSESFYRHLFTKFPYLSRINIGTSSSYPHDFTKRRATYASLRDNLAVGNIISPNVAAQLQDKFGSLTFELHERVLYVYAEHQRPSILLLSRMLSQGLWLAATIDALPN